MALNNWAWGTVIVGADVDRSGRVVKAEVVRKSGEYELDEASVRAVKNCVFAPRSSSSTEEMKKVNITVAWEVHSAPGIIGAKGMVAIGIQPSLQP